MLPSKKVKVLFICHERPGQQSECWRVFSAFTLGTEETVDNWRDMLRQLLFLINVFLELSAMSLIYFLAMDGRVPLKHH